MFLIEHFKRGLVIWNDNLGSAFPEIHAVSPH